MTVLLKELWGNDGIRSFKGIPFAAAPIGELRWKAPQPVQSWKGVRKCTAFGPSPMQAKQIMVLSEHPHAAMLRDSAALNALYKAYP